MTKVFNTILFVGNGILIVMMLLLGMAVNDLFFIVLMIFFAFNGTMAYTEDKGLWDKKG